MKDRFEKPPYIKYGRGDDFGLLGFDKALSEEDIAFVHEQLKTINGNPVSWEALEGAFLTYISTLFSRFDSLNRKCREVIPD